MLGGHKEEGKPTETQVPNVPPPVVETAPEAPEPDFADDLPF
jgi:hypothetical protein